MLYKDEIDNLLIPESILMPLPDPLLFSFDNYVDNEKQEWLFCVAYKEGESDKWLHVILLKNKILVSDSLLY